MDKYINKIINADCLDILKKLPDNSIDCFFSDIPYRLSQGGCTDSCQFGSKNKYKYDSNKIELLKSGKVFKHNEITPDEYLPILYEKVKDGSHLYIMVNSIHLADTIKSIEKHKFIINNILVMRKNNCVTNQWYMKDIEFTIFFRKGFAKPLNDCGIKSCIDVAMPRIKIHETQKPVEYVGLLIKNSTLPNDLVLDCFSGSGTTAIACHRLKRRFICIEKDEDYYKASIERLENEKAQLKLF